MKSTQQTAASSLLIGSLVPVACVFLAAVIVLSANALPAVIAWGAAVGIAALAHVTLRKRTLVGVIMIYGYLLFGASAALLYSPGGGDFYSQISGVASFATGTSGYKYLQVFDVVAISLWVAFYLFAERESAAPSTPQLANSTLAFMPVIRVPGAALLLAAAPLALDIYGTGFHVVLHATAYLEHSGPTAAYRVGRALGAVGVFLCGNILFSDPNRRNRVLAGLIASGYFALYLGVATRYFGLIAPMLYLGGLLSGKWTVRGRSIGLIVAAVASLIMVQLPIALRGEQDHGLVASINYILQDPGLLLADPIHNLLFGAPLTLYVGQVIPRLPLHDMATALSPLPSSLTDWAQIQPSLKLSPTNPYSALGHLLNYGWAYLAGIMAVFGAAYALLERLARRSVAPGLALLVLTAVSVVAVVDSTEYSLRTVARLAYYAAVILGLLVVVPRLSGDTLNQDARPVGQAGSSSARRVSVGAERAPVGQRRRSATM